MSDSLIIFSETWIKGQDGASCKRYGIEPDGSLRRFIVSTGAQAAAEDIFYYPLFASWLLAE